MAKNILHIDSSMRHDGSRSRALSLALVNQLSGLHPGTSTTTRDLSDGIAFIDSNWIEANFTPPGERTAEQRAALVYSDVLFNELKTADVLVIGTAIYNFGIPAALKAWVDMVVRAKEAFTYGAEGPTGLLEGKSAYVAIVSGGTKAGSEVDFAWPYLKHVLAFIGITNVTLIDSDLSGVERELADKIALEKICTLT